MDYSANGSEENLIMPQHYDLFTCRSQENIGVSPAG